MTCSRRQFLSLVPGVVGAGALSSLLTGCGNGPTIAGTVAVQNGQANLTFAQFARLNQVGGAVLVSTDQGMTLVVIRTSPTVAVALSAVCTHAGCLVDYDGAAMNLGCPCHGSTFSLKGAATGGPARAPLASYAAVVNADGIAVMVG